MDKPSFEAREISTFGLFGWWAKDQKSFIDMLPKNKWILVK